MSPIMIASLHYFIVAVGVKNLYELTKSRDEDFVSTFLKVGIIVGSIMFTISYMRVRPYLG